MQIEIEDVVPNVPTAIEIAPGSNPLLVTLISGSCHTCKEELDELFRQFDSLDVTRSGVLDQEDLRLMAKLRGAAVLD